MMREDYALNCNCVAFREEEETNKRGRMHTYTHTHTYTTNDDDDALFLRLVFRRRDGRKCRDLGHGKWHLGVMATSAGRIALYFDLERRTGDVVVAPFHQQDVVATFAHQVVDLVLVAAGVLDEHLVAGSLRSVNANE